MASNMVELELARVIIIDVLEPANTCFIITPFSDEFDSLSRIIEDAANQAGLIPIRTDKRPEQQDIIRDIQKGIKSAKIVVAVCNPVINNQSNLNAMYELGYADALGKSVLIVKKEKQQLPFDLGFRRLIEYSQQEEIDIKNGTSRFIVIRIKDLMREMIGKMDKNNNLLTNPDQKDITVIQRMYSVPHFWSKIQTILSYAKSVHHEMQTIHNFSLDHLLLKATEVQNDPLLLKATEAQIGNIKSVQTFYKALDDFHLYWYQSLIPEKLANLSKIEADVSSAMTYLKDQLKYNHNKYGYIDVSSEYYEYIKVLLKLYLNIKKELEKKETEKEKILDTRGLADLINQVTALSRQTKFLMTHADNLIRNLATLMCEE